MIAVRRASDVVDIGRDFVEAVSGKTVWKVQALGYGYKFAIKYECTGDEATTAAQQTMARENIKSRGFIFSRSE